MPERSWQRCNWEVLLALLLVVLLVGCSPYHTVRKWVGLDKGEEEVEEDLVPPEAQEETVMIDGKPYVRSKNPYWLTYPDQPEYIYVEKGREFVGFQQYFTKALAKAIGREQAKAAGKTIPPDKLQELVRAEVDRILREQGLGGFVSRAGGKEVGPYMGRAVAVIPNPETPARYAGANRTLAVGLGEALGRTKDIKVSDLDQVKIALGKAGIQGKLGLRPNIQALGDFLGVQGIVLTNIIPPEKGSTGFMVLEVYDTFVGNKAQSVVAPAGPDGITPQSIDKFVRDNSLRVGGELINMPWFGRVEFIKDNKVYLSLGQTAGLKVGDRLKVVEPGKEVINPATHASLGYTADTTQGELKVTELLGNTGAVAMILNGGPFKPNDKVKAK
ncbi:MAG: hypothetical protein AB1491_08870 [Thermodesulfobacteriota bacterium]